MTAPVAEYREPPPEGAPRLAWGGPARRRASLPAQLGPIPLMEIN
jgi:hypothetical protein